MTLVKISIFFFSAEDNGNIRTKDYFQISIYLVGSKQKKITRLRKLQCTFSIINYLRNENVYQWIIRISDFPFV